ncbi:MAG: KGG domain-containing protein [Candidatus Doudnabacteria bacterium]|nr:KGG domain-containing protein [Candidatus Doudnabacteria bacterium]
MATEDRGFASMDRKKQKEIASKGGKASHGGGRGRSGTSQGRSNENE